MTINSKSFRQNFLLLLISIILTIVVAEIVLRMTLPAPIIWTYPQEYYQYDPEIGHWLKPDQVAYTHDKVVSTNSVGIRDSEFFPEAPANVYRILAIGDSQTFGIGLDIADTWPKQLETLLRQNDDHIKTQVLNCGLPGSDTWQHEVILKRLIQQYNPDAVVLAMYVNDVVKRHTPPPPKEQKGEALKKRAIYILKRSSLLLTLRNALNTIRHNTKKNNKPINQEKLIISGEDIALNEGWNQVEKSLLSMKEATDKHSIKFLVVSLPRRDQVDGRLSGNTFNDKLHGITERYHIPMANMLGPLQMSYDVHGAELFIPWDGHNSKTANHVIAETIASALQDVIRDKD